MQPLEPTRCQEQGTGHGSALVIHGTAPNRERVMKEGGGKRAEDGNGWEHHCPARPAVHSHSDRQRGGTYRLSPVRGPILPDLLPVRHEGAWEKAMKGYSSGTAFLRDLYRRGSTGRVLLQRAVPQPFPG